jgi:diacylglycerol kinase (ATP)
MNYLFILNPNAGRKKNRPGLVDLIDRIMAGSAHAYEFAFTTAAGQATQFARQAVAEKFDIAVAVGGDGTVSEVAAGLVHSECALAVIPLGSGNGFARSMNIPLPLSTSISALISPAICTIDVGLANKKYFVGIAGSGYDALIGRKFQTFGIRGPLPYFLIAVREYVRYESQSYQIEIDGERLVASALLIAFANTRQYGNGAIIAPAADPADGLIDFCMIKSLPVLHALALVPMVFQGRIADHPSYFTRKCRSVKVKAINQKIFLHRDGEPDEMTDNLEISLVPAALRICTPCE